MRTYVFKLYHSKRNKRLSRKINLAGHIYNHCIDLHRRYYRLFGKSLNGYRLCNHIAKLKKTKRFGFWNNLGSQAIQDISEHKLQPRDNHET
jgi:putative transposase